jgi:hypothetical protein
MLKDISKHLRHRRTAGQIILELERRLRKFQRLNPTFKGTVPRAWHVSFAEDVGAYRDVLLRWVDGAMHVTMQAKYARYLHQTRLDQLMTVIVWMMRAGPDAAYLTFNLSDGESPSVARFSFSTGQSDVIALPDQYFLDERGFQAMKLIGLEAKPWAQRSDDIVWRGAAVGTGVMNPDPAFAQHPSIVQRIRLAHLCKGTEVDFAFVPNSMTGEIWQGLLRAELTGERVEEPTWADRKFAIDVDGFTNTWSNLFIRLAFGCCVLKVDSQFGYRQWYYDKLIAWEHFVPVKADLSDLFEKIAWARANEAACAQIAAQGQALAGAMTLETESAHAAATILEHWDGRDFDHAI